MSITNAQHNSIMREYERHQAKNRAVHEERLRYVYQNVEGYEALDRAVPSYCVAQGRKIVDGDTSTLEAFRRSLRQMTQARKRLLREAGLPEDYLDPLYDCPDCRDTGYRMVGDSKVKCHCFRQAEISLLYDQSHLAGILEKENYNTLSYSCYDEKTLPAYRIIIEKSREFVAAFPSAQNLLYYGTVGTGKTFLTHCVAKELLEAGHSVLYFSAPALFDALSRAAFDYRNRDRQAAASDPVTDNDLYGCELLIIDDLGTELTNAFTLSHLFTCIDERLKASRSTLISTNLSFADLKSRYQDRIFSRLASHYDFYKFTGPDIRIQLKKRDTNRK